MPPPINPVGWFEIYVQDIARAKVFYEAVFQITLEKIQPPGMELWAFPMNPTRTGCGGALVKMEGKDSGVGGIIIYFTCEDCAVEAARVQEHGGQVVKPKFPIGEYGFISLALDTEGNMIGLHSRR